jgi:hypothetical protein
MRSCALVFFNDIIIYNASYEDHIKHLKEIENFELLFAQQRLGMNQFACVGLFESRR